MRPKSASKRVQSHPPNRASGLGVASASRRLCSRAFAFAPTEAVSTASRQKPAKLGVASAASAASQTKTGLLTYFHIKTLGGSLASLFSSLLVPNRSDETGQIRALVSGNSLRLSTSPSTSPSTSLPPVLFTLHHATRLEEDSSDPSRLG
jgi:hypothetical protein